MRLESQMIVKNISNSLFKQDDFRNQRCLLREVIESRGHKVVFIGEMLSVMLEEIVIILGEVTKDSTRGIALDLISLKQIRGYAQKFFRYMDAYRKGLSPKQAEYADRRYKRHRVIPFSILNNCNKFTIP